MVKRIVLALGLLVWMIAGPAKTSIAAEPHAAAMEQQGEETKPPLLANPLAPGQAGHDARMQSLWVVIIFAVLLIILYPTAWKNVLAGLKSREDRIRKDIADAEKAQRQAESTLKTYNTQLATAEKKVQEMIVKAMSDGEQLAANIKAAAQKEAEDARQRAAREIESAKNQAISDFTAYAATLATNVAEKILKRNLNPQDQKDLLDRSLEEMQELSKN